MSPDRTLNSVYFVTMRTRRSSDVRCLDVTRGGPSSSSTGSAREKDLLRRYFVLRGEQNAKDAVGKGRTEPTETMPLRITTQNSLTLNLRGEIRRDNWLGDNEKLTLPSTLIAPAGSIRRGTGNVAILS